MILTRYLIGKYLLNFFIVITITMLIILLFDFIEIAKFFSNNRTNLLQVIKISFLKNYKNLNKTLPFIVLVSSIITFYQLNKSYELIALRVAGLSAFKIALPIIITNVIMALIVIIILNPIGSFSYRMAQKLMDFDNKKQDLSFIFNSTGVWFKTDFDNELSHVFHIKNISDDYKHSNNTDVYVLKDNNFIEKIHSSDVKLSKKEMLLSNAKVIDAKLNVSYQDEISFRIRLDRDIIKDNFRAPEDVVFYKLPSYIYALKRLGINSSEFQLYLINALILPLYYATMVIWGLVFTLSLPRSSNKEKKIAQGLLLGFSIYFLINLTNIFALNNGLIGLILSLIPVCLIFYLSLIFLRRIEYATP